MTSSVRTTRYLLGAALGLSLVLTPAAADAGFAVPAEKQDQSVMGVAAGSEAAATAASADTAQKTKKKKKASKPVQMVAVPAETVLPAGAPLQPPPLAAGAGAAQGAATADPAPAMPQDVPPAVTSTPQSVPAVAPQSAPAVASADAAPAGASAAPAAAAASTTAEATPAATTASPTAASTMTDAATPATATASTTTDAAAPAPKKRRQLGMHPAAAKPSEAASKAMDVIVRKDIIGVIPPTGRIAGRVLAKDGITQLAGAELVLDHKVFGSEHRFVTDSSGAFDIELPIGQYDLTIQRRHEIYESPASYSIARRGTLPIDFILLRDFEEEDPSAATGKGSASGGDVSTGNGVALDEGSARWLPEPRQEPEVVGSVVDLTSPEQDAPARSRKNGAESLGFIGSLLIVLIAL